MVSLFRRGIKPEQKKEPAINREIQVFTENVAVSRLISEVKDLKEISAEQIIETAKIAEIFDELDGKPLWEKLENWMGRCKEVAADAIDDEPYLSSRLVLLFQRQDEVVSGLRLCGKALGVEPEKQFAAVYHSLIAFSTKIPERDDLTIRRFGGRYPIDLAEREKGEKNGVLYIGTGAMVHLHRAVFEMRRQTTAFVTLAGDCVAAPFNAELPLGMPVKRALEFCGLSDDPTYICSTGSLTAESILNPETTYVEPNTKAILAFHRYDHAAPAPCIGCGRCMDVCPQQLPVFYLYAASLHKQASFLRSMGYERCFECGACTYACPSHLDLVPVLRQGKELAFASEKLMHIEGKADVPAQKDAVPEIPVELSEVLAAEETKQPAQTEVHEIPAESKMPAEAVLAIPPEEWKEPQNTSSAESELDDISREEAEEILAMQETLFGREVKKIQKTEEQEPNMEIQSSTEGDEKEPERLEVIEPPQIVQNSQPEEAEPDRDSESAKEELSPVSESTDAAKESEKIKGSEGITPSEDKASTESKPTKTKKTSRKSRTAKKADVAEEAPKEQEEPALKPEISPTPEEPEKPAAPKPVRKRKESVKKPTETAPSKPEAEEAAAETAKTKKSTSRKKAASSAVESVPIPEEHTAPKKAAIRPVAKKAKTTVKRSSSSKTAKDSQTKQSQEVKES